MTRNSRTRKEGCGRPLPPLLPYIGIVVNLLIIVGYLVWIAHHYKIVPR